MENIDADINALSNIVSRTSQAILRSYADRVMQGESNTDPAHLSKSLSHLLQLFEICDTNLRHGHTIFTHSEISELGNHGLALLDLLASWADQLELIQEAEEIHNLNLPLALWIVRHGGMIETLEPVVDSIAAYANHTSDVVALEELATAINEIIGSIAAQQQSLLSGRNQHAWRILNMNQSIIATRSQDIRLITEAYDRLIHNFPDDALNLLSKGIAQAEQKGFPPHVLYIMWDFYQRCLARHTLH